MHHNLDSMSHTFAGGAAVSDFLYPGAMLDPLHAGNDIVWLGSGTIEDISVQSVEEATDVTVQVFDVMDALGRPVKLVAAPFYRNAVIDALAVAKRSGLGDPAAGIVAGALSYNVVGPATPAVIVANGLRWEHDFRDESTARTSRSFQMHVGVHCGFGMAVRIDAADPVAGDITVAITFRPDTTGATRFTAATQATLGRSAHIPA